MAGTSVSVCNTLYEYLMITSTSKDDPLFADISYPSGSANKSLEGYELKNAKLSYFGRLNYNFAEKYIFEATMRADAADLSVLPATNRWGFFPSASAGWVLSNEDFFSPVKNVVSFMKLRASWGQNGSTSNLSGYKYSNSIDLNSTGYTSVCIHILTGILYKATGMLTVDYANKYLLEPLGIPAHKNFYAMSAEEHKEFTISKLPKEAVWFADPQGLGTPGYGLCMTAQDMAKI